MVIGLAILLLPIESIFADTVVHLHVTHVRADSEDFKKESDCNGLGDTLVWHYILNQPDSGTLTGTRTVNF